jgi:hypothetical protein
MAAARNLTLATCAVALLAGAASAQGYYDRPYSGRSYQERPASNYYDYRGNAGAPSFESFAAAGAGRTAEPAPQSSEPSRLPDAPAPPAESYGPSSRAYNAGATVADIAMQPAKDIGVKKTNIPPVLASAEASPYALSDASNCAQMAQALGELDEVLGADYSVERSPDENRAGKIAEAGGRAVVNSIIPFRGIVREVTGAAAADRAMASAVDAGIARRGFLRGLSTAQGCDIGAQAKLGR